MSSCAVLFSCVINAAAADGKADAFSSALPIPNCAFRITPPSPGGSKCQRALPAVPTKAKDGSAVSTARSASLTESYVTASSLSII